MNHITRYILVRLLGSFGMVYAFTLAASWLVLVLALFSLVTVKGQDIGVLISQSLLSSVTPAAILLPVCAMLGLGRTFSALRARHEIDAIHATGTVGPIHQAVGIFALIILLLSAVLEHYANPLANRAIENQLQQINADLIARSSQSGNYVEMAPGVTVRIARRSPDGGAQSFFLYDRSNPDQIRTFMAASADIGETDGALSIDMRNGSIQYLDVKTGNLSGVSFERYSVSLAQFPQSGPAAAGFRSLTTFELLSGAAKDEEPIRVLANIASRFALMLLAFSFPILTYGATGHPTGARAFARIPPELILIGMGVIIQIVAGVVMVYVDRENISAWPIMFGPGIGVLVVAAAVLAGRYWHAFLAVPPRPAQLLEPGHPS
jgi:lipopolysaccharide export system permease protein